MNRIANPWHVRMDRRLIIEKGKGCPYTEEEMWNVWSYTLAGRGFQFINARVRRGTKGIEEFPRKLITNYYPGKAGRLIDYMRHHDQVSLKYSNKEWTEVQNDQLRYYLHSLTTGLKPPLSLDEVAILYSRTEAAVVLQLQRMSRKKPTLLPFQQEKKLNEIARMKLDILIRICNEEADI